MVRLFKKSFLIFIVNLLAWLPTGTFAQQQNEFAVQLQRFDRNLELVRELVTSFDNMRGMQLVNEAEGLRNNAVTAFNNRNFVEARLKLTLAFGKLETATKVTLDGPVRILWNQVESLLEKAEQEVLSRNHKEAERLLREAKENFEAAKRARNGGQVLKVVEHLRVAKNLAQRALDMVSSLDGKIDDERQKFEFLLERAREAAERTDDARAKQIFQQAVRLAHNAEEALRNGNLALAKKLLNQATLLLLRVIDMAPAASTSTDQIAGSLSRLRERLDEAGADLADARNPQARRLYDRAKRLSNEADLSVKSGRNHEAMIKIDLAEKMLLRARRMLSRQNPQVTDRVADEIIRTQNEIADARNRLPDQSKDAGVLLNMARFSVDKAERAAAAGMHGMALEALLAAQRFLSKAGRTESSAGATTQKEAVLLRLSQLDAAISDSEGDISPAGNSLAFQLLSSAKEIRDLSFQSIQNGNYSAASEGIQVALDLVQKSKKSDK